MTVNKWEIIFYTFIILALFFSGFFIGRSTIETKIETKIEYVKGDTITNVIYEPKPEYIQLPVDTLNIIKQCIKDGIYKELWPEKIVTEVVEITKEDTTKIMVDWATKRIYDETIFSNDTIGSCKINAEVQYNRMHLLGYTYTPITKQVTETKIKVKTFSPFIGTGYMNNPWGDKPEPLLLFNGGVFIKEKYGIQLQLTHDINNEKNYVGGSFLYKF